MLYGSSSGYFNQGQFQPINYMYTVNILNILFTVNRQKTYNPSIVFWWVVNQYLDEMQTGLLKYDKQHVQVKLSWCLKQSTVLEQRNRTGVQQYRYSDHSEECCS